MPRKRQGPAGNNLASAPFMASRRSKQTLGECRGQSHGQGKRKSDRNLSPQPGAPREQKPHLASFLPSPQNKGSWLFDQLEDEGQLWGQELDLCWDPHDLYSR